MLRTRVWRDGRLTAHDLPVDLVAEHLQRPDVVLWIDVVEPTSEEFDKLAHELGFHPLAVEDATGRAQRPKFEVYEGHYFLVTYAVSQEGSDLHVDEVDVFFDKRWLVTVHKDRPTDLEPIVARAESFGDIGSCGTGRLLHALLDAMVDTHLAAAELLEDEVQDLENALSEEAGQSSRGLLGQTHDLRRALAALRRVVAPMDDVLVALVRDRLDIIDDSLEPYYRDVADHAVRAAAMLEAERELLTGGMQTHLALQSNRQNEITKQLASWAAILGVCTVIAGIYGMNFALIPDEGSLGGFLFAVGLMLVLSVGLFVWFRRRDWL